MCANALRVVAFGIESLDAQGIAVGDHVHLDICYVKITNCTLCVIKAKGSLGCKRQVFNTKYDLRNYE